MVQRRCCHLTSATMHPGRRLHRGGLERRDRRRRRRTRRGSRHRARPFCCLPARLAQVTQPSSTQQVLRRRRPRTPAKAKEPPQIVASLGGTLHHHRSYTWWCVSTEGRKDWSRLLQPLEHCTATLFLCLAYFYIFNKAFQPRM